VTDEKKEKKIQNLKEALKKERGYVLPQWEFMAEKDVDFMEAYNNLYNRALTDGKALPAKTRELIAIALLAYRGFVEETYTHAKRALKLGATKEELMEAVETSIIPGGAPTFSVGLKALMRIEEDEKKGK
jgi:alkylhydroperoxidase/carboxymuconolactone decarboxylase family protein YurZ